MAVEIISGSISTKVWDQARIKLVTPGSAVRHVSVVRHVTDCATQPGIRLLYALCAYTVCTVCTPFKNENSVEPHQLASNEASGSGSTLVFIHTLNPYL